MKTADELFDEAMAAGAKGDMPGRVRGLQEALLVDPKHHGSWNNRGIALLELGHPFDAIMNFERAIALEPGNSVFYNNRGTAYMDLGQFDIGEKDFKKAVFINSQFPEALMNLGNLYMKTRETDMAISFYRRSVAANPNYVDAHLGLGVALLEAGHYKEGAKEYEWRWKSNQMVPRGFTMPEWNGEKANSPDDILVFYGEQGHGDSLQFVRFAPMIKKMFGGKIVVEVRQPLVRIFKSAPGIDQVLSFGEKIPEAKYCLPMVSAMKFMDGFYTKPYLKADPHLTNLWRQRTSQLPPGLRVGVCWAGGARPFHPIANSVNQRRSTNFAAFAPLAMPGVSWVSLQVGEEAHQVKVPPVGMTIIDGSQDIYDFYDTAALMETLDLVISVDTSVVHLAGALGKPTWLLSRYDNCWRWHNDARDSVWYPSLTQFRQPSHGDWAGMMQEVRGELSKLISQRKAA